MIVQLSSGQGPSECELAVLKLYEALKKEYPDIEFLSAHEAREKGCYTSIIFTTERDLSDLEGSIQWICRSPFRPNHKRKNWFVDVSIIPEMENICKDQDIRFEKRVMHPPDNMINSLISYVNSLIYTKALSEIYKTQLDPTISYLHEPGVRRYSLCLDLTEVFKPLIGDRLIFSLLNRRQITAGSFTKELNFMHLKQDASRLIVSEFENRLKKTIMHRELGRKVSYQYLMRLEAYRLIKHLIGEKEYEGFRIWW